MPQKEVAYSQIHQRMRKQALNATGQLEKSATRGIKLNAMLFPHETYFIVIRLGDVLDLLENLSGMHPSV